MTQETFNFSLSIFSPFLHASIHWFNAYHSFFQHLQQRKCYLVVKRNNARYLVLLNSSYAFCRCCCCGGGCGCCCCSCVCFFNSIFVCCCCDLIRWFERGKKHIHEKYYAHTHTTIRRTTTAAVGRFLLKFILFVCFVQIKYANELLIHAHFVLAICGGCMWFASLFCWFPRRIICALVHETFIVFFCLCFCFCGRFLLLFISSFCTLYVCACVCVYVENSHWEKHQWQMKRARIEERKHP